MHNQLHFVGEIDTNIYIWYIKISALTGVLKTVCIFSFYASFYMKLDRINVCNRDEKL